MIYVDVNQPAVATHTAKAVLTDKDGRLICTRCGQSITTRVMEIQRKPYDTVCFRIEQMGDTDVKMPNTAMAEASNSCDTCCMWLCCAVCVVYCVSWRVYSSEWFVRAGTTGALVRQPQG